MKKRSTILLAAVLCLFSLGLIACGGSKPEEASAPVTETASAPAKKFYGTWKTAAMESQGLFIVGDLSQLAEDDINMELTITEGGTATMVVNGESNDLTWELINDETLAIAVANPEKESASKEEVPGDDSTIELTYQDGSLVMKLESEGKTVDVTFTPDGTVEGYTPITVASAVPITSADGLAGTWNLIGINMLGVSTFGDAQTLSSAFSSEGESDYTLVLNEDGTGTLLGQAIEWKVTDTGATIIADGSDVALLGRDGNLLVDMAGTIGFEMCMLFGK